MKTKPDQAALLRKARASLGMTTEQLAGALGKSLPAVRAWLLPKGAKARRNMPRSSLLLLERILAEHRAGKRKS